MTRNLESTGQGNQWRPVGFRELVNDSRYTTVILASISFFVMSIFIHFPLQNSPVYYTDFLDSFWTRPLSGPPEVVTGIPYVTYQFEYPPICGLIVWLGGWASKGSLFVFLSVEYGLLLLFFVLTAHFVYQFLDHLKLDHNRQLIYSIFAPSVLFYGAYNFDVIQTFFLVLALYLFIARSRRDLSALSLGLAIATKLSPALLVPLFWQDIKDKKKILRFTLIVVAVLAASNIPFMLANFNTWYSGYLFLKDWGLEDSFLVWIFPNSTTWYTPTLIGLSMPKLLSYCLLGLFTLLTYVYARSKPLLLRAFMVTGIFILFSYIATPQMNLDLLPFFALVPLIPLSLFYLFEFSNVLIILTWFMYQFPTLPGLAQTFALVRQIYLGIIIGILGFSKRILK